MFHPMLLFSWCCGRIFVIALHRSSYKGPSIPLFFCVLSLSPIYPCLFLLFTWRIIKNETLQREKGQTLSRRPEPYWKKSIQERLVRTVKATLMQSTSKVCKSIHCLYMERIIHAKSSSLAAIDEYNEIKRELSRISRVSSTNKMEGKLEEGVADEEVFDLDDYLRGMSRQEAENGKTPKSLGLIWRDLTVEVNNKHMNGDEGITRSGAVLGQSNQWSRIGYGCWRTHHSDRL